MSNDGASCDDRSSLARSLVPSKSFALTKERARRCPTDFVGRVTKSLNYRRDKSRRLYGILLLIPNMRPCARMPEERRA